MNNKKDVTFDEAKSCWVDTSLSPQHMKLCKHAALISNQRVGGKHY